MAVKYGFYDAINKDRVYSASDMTSIFEGVICDGIFRHVGKAFAIGQQSALTFQVKSGRAWLAYSWVVNTGTLTLTLPNNSIVLVGIEVNRGDRINSIKYVTVADDTVTNPTGYATHPDSPTKAENIVINESAKYFYPLYRVFTQNNAITKVDDLRGSSACPWARNTDQGSLEAALASANARYDEVMGELQNLSDLTNISNRISSLETYTNSELDKLRIRTNQRGVFLSSWNNWFIYYADSANDAFTVFIPGIYMADEYNDLYVNETSSPGNNPDKPWLYLVGVYGCDGTVYTEDLNGFSLASVSKQGDTWYGGQVYGGTSGLYVKFTYRSWMINLPRTGFATLRGGIYRGRNE